MTETIKLLRIYTDEGLRPGDRRALRQPPPRRRGAGADDRNTGDAARPSAFAQLILSPGSGSAAEGDRPAALQPPVS
jgi:hypothetical protein